MTQRFYFDLTDGESTLRDDEGVLAPDLDEAIAAARAVLAEMRDSGDLADGEDDWLLVIRDEGCRTLTQLPVVSRALIPVVAS
ncbi:MAG TPA: hypothetical protein VF641_04265 [Methylobacterium sp.]